MEQYTSVQQINKKEEGKKKKKPIYPLTVIQAVFDAKTGASLEAILAQFNSIYVQYQGTPEATRNIIPVVMRRPGLTITYMNMESETITERANSAVQKDNDHWGLDVNWSRIDELSLSGEISVSAKGTWIINGEDTGVKAVGPKGDNGLTPWLKTIDNKLHFSYDNVTWEPCSENIAAWFRFNATSSDGQGTTIGKIQISRDNKTWTDLSPEITNNLRIQGYVATASALPGGKAVGTIYGVGPTYDASDTAQTNPKYRIYVYDGKTWVDNGTFTSIAAGVVQETGNSETEVMSQKATTQKLSELASNEGMIYGFEYGAIDTVTGEKVENTIRVRTRLISIKGIGRKLFQIHSPSGIRLYYHPTYKTYSVHGYKEGSYVGALNIDIASNGFYLDCDGTFNSIIVSLRKGGEEITVEEKDSCYGFFYVGNMEESYILSVVGNDDNYVKGVFSAPVKKGNKYRIWVLNPDIDMSGVTVSTSAYDRFSVGLEKLDGEITALVQVRVTEELAEYYDIDAPDYGKIRINARATLGERLVCILEDITFSSQFDKNIKTSGSGYDFSLKDENGNVLFAIDEGHIKTKYFNSKSGGQSFEAYQRQTRFTVQVESVQPQLHTFESIDLNSSVESKIVSDYAVLYLPETYKASGKPTKLIVFCKQGGTYIDDDEDPIFKINIFNYMLYLGYAVLGVDGVPDEIVSSLGVDNERVVGNYMAVQATKKAYDYVIQKFNIDRNGAFVFGYSQGGHYAQNVVDLSGIPVLACAELAPVCSMRYHQWDLASTKTIAGTRYTKAARLNVARLFGFPKVSNNTDLLALEYDQTKVQGYDPWTRNVENPYDGFIIGTSYGDSLWGLPSNVSIDDIEMKKYLKAPLKIWCADNDATLGADVMKVFIKACKNAGCVADIEVYNSGGHRLWQEQEDIGTFIENGVECILYPLAKSIAVWFNTFGGNNLK